MKNIIVSAITIIAILYCLRFGYIWTAYGHGGQFLGVPFAMLLFILTLTFFLSKGVKIKRRLFHLTFTFFLALAGFSLTIELIRKTKENYFEFLYYEPEGWVNEILLGWFLIGIITYIGIEYNYRKSISK